MKTADAKAGSLVIIDEICVFGWNSVGQECGSTLMVRVLKFLPRPLAPAGKLP
jgi:hypothetical protein